MYKNIINALREDQIIDFLAAHGAEESKRTDDYIWFTTICHGGDSHKLCYYRHNKSFRCFTHCGRMSVFDLVQKVLNCTFSKAYKYLAALANVNLYSTTGIQDSGEEPLDQLQKYSRARTRKTERHEPVLPRIDANVLTYFDTCTYYTGWRNEGIEANTMRRFGIRWNEINQAIVIPHVDIDGNLVGIRRRLTHDDTGNKYMPLILNNRMYNHPLGANLYGLYEHQEAIRRTKQAIVFEGEKSVLKHHQFYGDDSNSVAVCGFSITPYQRDLLLGLGIEEVILAFDKDTLMHGPTIKTERYRRYCESINNMGRMFTPYCKAYALVDMTDKLDLKDSPVDKGQGVFEYLLQHKEIITN